MGKVINRPPRLKRGAGIYIQGAVDRFWSWKLMIRRRVLMQFNRRPFRRNVVMGTRLMRVRPSERLWRPR